MLRPDIWVSRVTDITVDMLKGNGIDALFLDVDNTLSTHHGTKIVDGFFRWKEEMEKSGIKLIILSNSKRFRIEPFAKRVGIDYISLAAKPFFLGYLKASKRLGVPLKSSAIAGDQIFTDILGAKTAGCKSILLEPIKPEEKLSFRIRRKLERKLKARYIKKGWFK